MFLCSNSTVRVVRIDDGYLVGSCEEVICTGHVFGGPVGVGGHEGLLGVSAMISGSR